MGEAQPGASLAGDPRGGGAGGVAADRLPGAGDLGQRADRARGRTRSRSRSAASSGALTIALSLVLAIGLFFVIPVGATSLIKDQLGSSLLFWLVEGILRTAIFIGYIVAISRLRDLRRVFEYHGAEHKTISCYEAGDRLAPARAELYSRLHPRCGTSFLLVVMVVAIFVFAPLGLPAWYWLLASRILGIPLIAGISYEVIKWAGRNRRKGWVRALMWPGLMLQNLTTREPDRDQLAVAIAALEAVLAVETPSRRRARGDRDRRLGRGGVAGVTTCRGEQALTAVLGRGADGECPSRGEASYGGAAEP